MYETGELQIFSLCCLSCPSCLQWDAWCPHCLLFRLDVNPPHVTRKVGFELGACGNVIWEKRPPVKDSHFHLHVTHSSLHILWNPHQREPLVVGPRLWITYPWLHNIRQPAFLLLPVINYTNWESNHISFYLMIVCHEDLSMCIFIASIFITYSNKSFWCHFCFTCTEILDAHLCSPEDESFWLLTDLLIFRLAPSKRFQLCGLWPKTHQV